MTEVELNTALDRIPEVAGRVLSARIERERPEVTIDVGGLASGDQQAIEARVRAALPADARILLTAERKQRRILAIASGKGGVGKSTVAANLAIALARTGLKVGLVDADIYGPSQPKLMDAPGKPEAYNKQLLPVATRHGVPLLSIGQLVEPGKAIAWRGPMAAGALTQLVDAAWGDTELLIMDLPPGTGDVQLTMIQKHRPMGAIIVSTPQDLALIDAARAIDLFGQAGVPVIGLVENMAGYICPHCGALSDPFGSGGAETDAAARGIPFLGRIPLTIAIRTASDAGEPPAAGDGADAEPFRLLAEKVAVLL
ncbi:ATP-binding protein involved in chromosome partitioning [Sphingomonas vulcanisoli]|uniref:Iron-sulfur cluster carrier protein n=1 Tax=Sphingomonas vulcanisoli TaxID=1658060 RepID=A0ABX0TR00_9SPHN|nr:Mrp/NBP35 family ATP-binding protein [Sphingomonas vulcanisoli]NIJ07958.1 ATP-binding protein involved in chromosome partitioning [Sphingomonas vulcanisoli]